LVAVVWVQLTSTEQVTLTSGTRAITGDTAGSSLWYRW
jgi:hypothetical protein